MPYGLGLGNHDGAPSGTGNYNTYFGSRISGQPTYGGRYGTSDYDNTYATFSASGMDFIVLFLEYDDSMTSTSNPVLVWADGILAANPTRRAIVVTHNLLSGNNLTAQGQAIYDALKDRPNLFLMLGGHLDETGQNSFVYEGRTVYALRSDYQFIDSQQSGYLRIMRFSPADDKIYVTTYSPTQGIYRTINNNAFDLAYDMDGAVPFSLIGSATVPSGSDATVNWSGLANNKAYEWYAVADNGGDAAVSPTWSFTTEATTNQAPVITEGASTSVTMSEDGSPTAFNLTLHASDADAGDTLTWSVPTPASNGTASASGTGTSKIIAYSPNANFSGSDSFVVEVSDGKGGVDTIAVNVTVQPVNDAPVCSDTTLTTAEDITGEATPLCSDVDAGDVLSYSIVTQPAHGSVVVVAGKLSYVPANNYNGPDTFTYKANDTHIDSNAAAVTVTVSAVNDAPVVTNPGTQTSAEGTIISLQITATDVDLPAQTLTYSATGLPEGLAIDTATGLISGTISYHASSSSPFNVTVTVTDGVTPSQQSFTWNVSQVSSGLCGSDPNLVACWPMDEGSGSVVIDATSFGNDGSITGSPAWVAGQNGQALNLSGTSQYVIVPDSNSLDATNAITLAAWVKPTKTAFATQNIIKKVIGTTTPNGYEISLSSAGKVFTRFNGGTVTNGLRVDSTTSYPLNGTAWMHIAATYDGTTIKLYINGVLETSSSVAFTIGTNTTNLGIGAEPASTVINLFQGTIDDARVYNRALSFEEVQVLAGVVAPTCYALTLSHTGQGADPIASPASSTGCSAGQYVAGESVSLSGAAPATGWQISGWSGTNNDASTASTNTLTMPAAAHAAAVTYSQTPYTLTIISAHGTVTKDPDQATYTYGQGVTLTAVPDTGWSFASWSGDATGTANPVIVTIDGDKSVTANYAQNQYAISGNAGVTGTTITYTGGSTTAGTGGAYSFNVPSGWSGTVTPSYTGYTFTPASRNYSNVMADQTGQDYAATPVVQPPSGLTCTTLNPKPGLAEYDSSGHKPQSRVWRYNNTWWAVFSTNASGASSAGTWLWKLEGTTWMEVQKLSTSTNVKADVKPLGDMVYVLLLDGSNPTSGKLASVQFSGETYGAPVISDVFSMSGPMEIATLDIDSNQRMWVSTSNAANGVRVYYSDSPYSSWNGPITLEAANVWDDDQTAIVALPGINRVGVLWGNQYNRVFKFFVHQDGADPSTWTTEIPPYNPDWQNLGSGNPTYGVADDHINLSVASDGTLYAAVKTSYDTAGYPKMALEVRRPDGVWDDLYGVDKSGTRPNILLDEVHGYLTYIYTSNEGYNSIVYRQSTTQDINFTARTTLRSGAFNDVTSLKGNYTDEFVVLYWSSSEVAGQKCSPTLTSGADLAITKSDGLSRVRPGDPVTYTIQVTTTVRRQSPALLWQIHSPLR